MVHKTKSLRFFCLVMVLILSVFLLGTNLNFRVKASQDAVSVWTTYATEKILRDKTDGYDSVRLPAEISLRVCKGEYESIQIILTANQDIADYRVEKSVLTDGAGNTFAAENILVYHEKYIQISNLYEGNGASEGWYPDALLPMDKAVEYRENKIAEGENQGVYITFNIPVGQKAGTYTGALKVIYDGAEFSVPVVLNVADITVSQTTHTKSKFNATFSHYLGELNSTQEMLDSYISVMAEYRISPGLVQFGNDANSSDESISAYVQKAYDLLQKNPKMSTFAVPTYTMTDSATGLPTLNGAIFSKYLKEIVELSVDSYDSKTGKGFDMMSYAICTVSIIDEPDLNNTIDRVPGVAAQFENAVSSAKDYLTEQVALKGIPESFASEIRDSLDEFPLIVSMTTMWEPEEEYKDIITSCPLISLYDTKEQRDFYETQGQRWIYSCVQPTAPYPTYHIDDTLVSARSMSWMMSEYDITGNFFWAADLYQKYTGNGAYMPIDDYYGTAERYPGANGDGFLFYPGAPYGMDQPLASLRLEAIRDGAEEYELWYALHEKYSEYGYGWADVQRQVSSLIYQGAKVVSTSSRMQQARDAVIELLSLVESDAQVGITSVVESGTNVSYTVKAAQGCTLTAPQGINVENKGESEWLLTVDRTSSENILSFTVEKEGQEYNFGFNVGGKVTVAGASQLIEDIGDGKGVLTKSVVAADSEGISGGSENLLKLSVGEVQNSNQYFMVSGEILESMDSNVKTVVLKIYNPSEEEISLRIAAKYKGSAYSISVMNCKLKAGWNSVEITDMSLYGGGAAPESLSFYLTDIAGNYENKILYIDTVKVYCY